MRTSAAASATRARCGRGRRRGPAARRCGPEREREQRGAATTTRARCASAGEPPSERRAAKALYVASSPASTSATSSQKLRVLREPRRTRSRARARRRARAPRTTDRAAAPNALPVNARARRRSGQRKSFAATAAPVATRARPRRRVAIAPQRRDEEEQQRPDGAVLDASRVERPEERDRVAAPVADVERARATTRRTRSVRSAQMLAAAASGAATASRDHGEREQAAGRRSRGSARSPSTSWYGVWPSEDVGR